MIKYKEFYNKDRGLPEPIWGTLIPPLMVQCPTCGSRTNLRWSGSAGDPEEILRDTVRCTRCGYIADYYEACKQRFNHPGEPLLEVEH